MKKFLTLKNVLLCCAAVLALVAFILSFTASVNLKDGNGVDAALYNFIWGPKRFSEQGSTTDIPSSMLPMPVAALPLVGALLVVVGVCAAVVSAFLVKKSFAKWIVVGCGALAVIGGVFFFFFRSGGVAQFAKLMGMSIEQAESAISAAGIKFSSAGAVVAGVLGILAGGSCIASQFLPEKK